MLYVEHLDKTVSNKYFQLKDISFHLPKGYICGLIGENGAGKTTLLRSLMGLYNFHGSVTIDGYDLAQDEAFAKGKLGILCENGFFQEGMTSYQIGIYYGELYDVFDMDLYNSYLDTFHINREQKYKHLSKGMKMKVQLAFALSHDAKLFLFDEPTAGWDRDTREIFLKICTDIVSDGERSILISSHITDDLDRIADYIGFMQEGKLLFCTTKEELCDRFRIVSGEDYKLNLIAKEAVVYKEKGTYNSSAMIVNSKRYEIDDSIEVHVPNIREFMHYYVKGGKQGAEAFAEKYL